MRGVSLGTNEIESLKRIAQDRSARPALRSQALSELACSGAVDSAFFWDFVADACALVRGAVAFSLGATLRDPLLLDRAYDFWLFELDPTVRWNLRSGLPGLFPILSPARRDHARALVAALACSDTDGPASCWRRWTRYGAVAQGQEDLFGWVCHHEREGFHRLARRLPGGVTGAHVLTDLMESDLGKHRYPSVARVALVRALLDASDAGRGWEYGVSGWAWVDDDWCPAIWDGLLDAGLPSLWAPAGDDDPVIASVFERVGWVDGRLFPQRGGPGA